MSDNQLDLLEALASATRQDPEPDRKPTPRERFLQFHAANPEVYQRICQIARELKGRGFAHCGIRLVWERLRWLTALEVQGDGFRLNNNHAPYYARLIDRRERDLRGFFRFREHPHKVGE